MSYASPTPATAVVCCMCGDHGLPQELFRCKICLVRSQHKYCSDLYPRATTYRACNWCLREEGGKSLARELTADHHRISTSSSSDNSNNSGRNNSGVKLRRGAFVSHLNKPIKKQRMEPSPSLGRAKHGSFDSWPSLECERDPLTLGKIFSNGDFKSQKFLEVWNQT